MARTMIWPLGILLVSATGLLNPAAAAVTFEFTQTSSSPPGLYATITITLDNAAFWSGISIDRFSGGCCSSPDNLLGTGIDALDISTSIGGASLGDFVQGGPSTYPFPYWTVDLSSPGGGGLTGEIYFLNASDDQGFDLLLGDPVSTIAFGTDDVGSGCGSGGFPCVVSGTFALVGSIPEPASLALLASGVLGLAVLRRRGSGR
jgi:hypothetical protein